MRGASAGGWRCGQGRGTGTRGTPRRTRQGVRHETSCGMPVGRARAEPRKAFSRKALAEPRVRTCVVDDGTEMAEFVAEHVPPALGQRVIATLRRLTVRRFAGSVPLFDQPAVFETLDRFVECPRP